MSAIEHLDVRANGANFHVARTGSGPALMLLHGWPEFWWTWEPVMQRLADTYTLIVPDLRGFGDSDKPGGPWGADGHAADLVAILDVLGIERAGLVGHDVTGAVMQVLGRQSVERWPGLFLFDFVYPGIGPRLVAPDRLIHIWYQSFHQHEVAVALVGASRDSCRAYFGHIIRSWAHRPAVFDDATLDRFVDNFMKPGNLAGGFSYYKAANAGRLAIMRGDAPRLPPITVPTCIRWAEHDPLFPYAWTDRLGETFADLDFAMFPDVGHFPHREDPDHAAAEIGRFFARVGWS